MRLYTFYRSLATYRVRIALALKGLSPELVTLDLLTGDQFQDEFRSRNPEASVPLLEIDGLELAQSLAILEYLEETRPDPRLLPDGAEERAVARRLALISAADSHPLVVPRARKFLKETFGHSDDEVSQWCGNWLMRGCEAMEKVLAGRPATDFAVGDTPGYADVCIVPHLHGLRNFGADPAPFARLMAIETNCLALDAFSATHPRHQPDFPG